MTSITLVSFLRALRSSLLFQKVFIKAAVLWHITGLLSDNKLPSGDELILYRETRRQQYLIQSHLPFLVLLRLCKGAEVQVSSTLLCFQSIDPILSFQIIQKDQAGIFIGFLLVHKLSSGDDLQILVVMQM